ncbi:MAG: exodeoxyribonuclease V subunit alpha [Parachlamydiaceae bacterium]|nr:exodeoxyribonuclease V subunit alpha [Parachlamydiaceae bacterium]
MLGLAQKLFLDKAATVISPWKEIKQNKPPWPLLEIMLQAKWLGYVDLALAQRLLQPCPQTTEGMAAFLCHLSMAARQGHLCVTINTENIYPTVDSIWLPPADYSGEPLPEVSHALHELSQMIRRAAETLPAILLHEVSLVADKEALYSHPIPSSPICKNGHRYYLQRFWVLESHFLKHLLRISQYTLPTLALDQSTIQSKVSILLEHKQLLEDQGSAVIHGCLHTLTLITGGPGTGKTHTAGVLLRVLWEGLTSEQRQGCRIGLAAPTGKAAANLEGSICRALQGVEGFPATSAKTLHSLLGIGKNQSQGPALVLPYDVLLVDESSMIDVDMMGKLLAAVKPGSRLIMLGDRFQLPPVEAGSLFADLITLFQKNSLDYHVVTELKVCLRAELRSIVDLASLIKSGQESEVQALFKNSTKDSGIAFIPFELAGSNKEQQRRLLAYGSDKFPCIDSLAHPLAILKEFARFRILTPLRKGPFGVEVLNALFLQMAIRKTRQRQLAFLVAPIMIVQNDHRQELFNGEVGLLVRPISSLPRNAEHSSSMSGSYALFAARMPEEAGGIRNIPALMLPKYEYAYCLSVHKSQGSEFDHVLMLLPEGSEHFGREVLYTGVTRARKALEIWSTNEILSRTIAQISQRHSGVIERGINN